MRRQRASGIALVELILVVAIALVLVAIAWPAWQRSVRRGRTVEAVLNVRRLYDAAATYYHTAHFDKNGVPIPRQFPQTASWTPNGPGVCCATLAQVCDPATYAKQWGTTTWQALHFSMDEPFHYSYQFDSAGVDAAANFTALASGDLSCDGKRFSLFFRTGAVLGGRRVASPNGLTILDSVE